MSFSPTEPQCVLGIPRYPAVPDLVGGRPAASGEKEQRPPSVDDTAADAGVEL